jgi:amidase
MGLQIIGPRGSDKRLLQIGAAWHAATDWPGRRPPSLWKRSDADDHK